MHLFQKYESCTGLSLPAFGRFKIELWFVTPGYSIHEHTHDKQDIKLVLLFGHNVRFHRRKRGMFLGESFLARWRDIGKVFTINAGDSHSFDVSGWPLVFLNFEHWKCEPTSAAEDLTLVTT